MQKIIHQVRMILNRKYRESNKRLRKHFLEAEKLVQARPDAKSMFLKLTHPAYQDELNWDDCPDCGKPMSPWDELESGRCNSCYEKASINKIIRTSMDEVTTEEFRKSPPSQAKRTAYSLLMDLGEHESAGMVAQLEDEHAAVWIYKSAMDYLRKCDYQIAIQLLQFAMEMKKEYYQAYFRMGEAFYLKKNLEAAIEQHSLGISIYDDYKGPDKLPAKAWGHAERGLCYFHLNRFEDALADLQIAVDAWDGYEYASKDEVLELIVECNRKISERDH